MNTDTTDLLTDIRRQRDSLLQNMIDRVLTVSPLGDDVFAGGDASSAFDRIYGGQIMAQALMAAAQTVPDGRSIHALHTFFLRLGQPDRPVTYRVERLRDTRTFSNRLVRAEQDGALLAILTQSFRSAAEGISHQSLTEEAPDPETLPDRDALLVEAYGADFPVNSGVPWPVDIRYVDRRPWDRFAADGANRVWMRSPAPLPDDQLLQTAMLLYASDLTMADPVVAHHPINWEDLIAARGMFGATLDHSFWLHAPTRFDDWLLHVQEAPRAYQGRGLTTGRFYTRTGELVATVAQEIVINETR